MKRLENKRVKKPIKVCVVVFLITAILLSAICFSGIFDKISAKKRVESLKSIKIPNWITEEIIDVHDYARTLTELSDIKGIVVHYVGNPNTSAENNRNYFNTDGVDVSSHFIVGLEGEIIQCLPIYEKSAASNQRNRDTISIEVCHPDESGEFNDKTYSSLIKLLKWLCENCDLKPNDIIRHYDVTGKLCPIYYVNNPDKWQKIKDDVLKALS